METLDVCGLEVRSKQARMLNRLILRKFNERMRRGQQSGEVYITIVSDLLSLPSLDNVDRLSTVYGYPLVRRALCLLDNLLFEEYAYGKVFFHPLWLKQFTRLLNAAKPRSIVQELLISSEN